MILRHIYISWCREISSTVLATDPQTKMQHYFIRFLTVSARLGEREKEREIFWSQELF